MQHMGGANFGPYITLRWFISAQLEVAQIIAAAVTVRSFLFPSAAWAL